MENKIFIFSLLQLLLLSELFSQIKSNEIIKIYSEEYFNIDCDSHFFYLSMKISSSKKVDNIIPFELTLLSPQELKFKCLIDTQNNKLNCFAFVPLGQSYRRKDLFFHLFYYPPKVPGVEFDSNSFIKHSRKWEDTEHCGNENYSLNSTIVDYNYWNKFSLIKLYGGECQSFYEDKEQKNVFYFNMTIGIEDEKIINFFLEDKNAKIKFIQEIKAPVYLKYKKYNSIMAINNKEYAYCKANTLVDLNNYKNIDLACKIIIQKKSVINSVIKISSFFDKIYIEIIKNKKSESQILNLFFKYSNNEKMNNGSDTTINPNEEIGYLMLDDNNGNNILCPNKPIFIINTKDTGIYYGSYSNVTKRYTFYLKGTLTNGYKYENNSLVKLDQTSDEITFPLILTDNALINNDDTDAHVQCLLSSFSLFDQEDNTIIQCLGQKKDENPEIDLTLNYVQKKNNNCTNIIIIWPELEYYGNKKHIYSYELNALSMQQKDFTCDEGIFFTFYINIYALNKEPKIWFDLPLLSPEGIIANCELFDERTIMCSIDLRYKKIVKNSKISLHKKGTKLILKNSEGNENIFIISDFTDLGKSEYSYITLKSDCGENVIFGTLQDMGLSKKSSIILGICGALFMLLLIIFCIIYIIHCFTVRCKRGKKIATTEESKDNKDIHI